MVDGILTAILAGGHALLIGVPGLAKTLMVQTVAEALDLIVQPGAVHPRPDAERHHRHRDHRGRPDHRPARVPVRARARSSPTWCWPTRSTAPRPRPRRRCSRRCRSTRSPPAGTTYHAARPVLRAGDPEPDRAGGHLPPARGPARPVHARAPGRLSQPGARKRRSSSRPPAPPGRRSHAGARRAVGAGDAGAGAADPGLARADPRRGDPRPDDPARPTPTRPAFIKEYVEWGAGPARVAVPGARRQGARGDGRPADGRPGRRAGGGARRCCGTGWSPTSPPRRRTGPARTWCGSWWAERVAGVRGEE